MATKRFYRRRFLNLRGHHAGAYVIADCGVATWDDERRIEADLTVAACSRVATLDFGHRVDDRSAARNALYKARTLLAVVSDFVEALEALQEEFDSGQRP